MHWWGQNWGNVIAIVALVSAVPLSVAGNLLTPIIKNWWAERSVLAAGKRIVQLMDQLELLEKIEPISEGEGIILSTLAWGARVFTFTTAMVFGYLQGWLQATSEHLHWPRMPLSLLTIGPGILILIGAWVFTRPLEEALAMRSPQARDKLRRSIQQLERKITSFGN